MTVTRSDFITFKDVVLGYGPRTVLSKVNFKITKGDFLGIVGPNGSGKTTLLRSILGWVKPQVGKIDLAPGLKFGYVPQRNAIDALFPLTAQDIVLMGLYAHRAPWQKMTVADQDASQSALNDVGLSQQAGLLFSELSGGQQQRALLARALVGKPDILILDEPTNGMDLVSESMVMDIIQKVHDVTGMTTILVTHLLHVVAKHAQSIGLIKGDFIEFGPTDSLLTSHHLSELYGTPILVSKIDGKTVVMTK